MEDRTKQAGPRNLIRLLAAVAALVASVACGRSGVLEDPDLRVTPAPIVFAEPGVETQIQVYLENRLVAPTAMQQREVRVDGVELVDPAGVFYLKGPRVCRSRSVRAPRARSGSATMGTSRARTRRSSSYASSRRSLAK